MSKPLRAAMPLVTAFIDDYRDVFGPDLVDPSIRAGMQGIPLFHAKENGHELGTPSNMQGIKCSETLVGPMALKKRVDK